jgi:hypothetical protein
MDICVIDNYLDFFANIKHPVLKLSANKLVPFFQYKYNIQCPRLQKLINITANLIILYF